MKASFLFLVCTVTLFIGSSWGKQCYVCSTAVSCAGDIASMPTVECSGSCQIKYTVSSASGASAVSVSARSCSSLCYEYSSTYTMFGVLTSSFTNCCNGDKCNGNIAANPDSLQTCVKCSGSSSYSSDDCGTVATDTSTVKCPGKCFTEVTSSTYWVSYKRGCSAVCTDIDVEGKRLKCCEGAACNKNASDVIPSGYTACWSCTGDGSHSCMEYGYDPKAEASAMTICKGKCSKSKGKVLGITAVTRSCDTTCTAQSTSFFGVKSEVWCCDGNKCNGASNIYPQSGIFVLLIWWALAGNIFKFIN